MQAVSRFEYKYKISYKQYLAIKNELQPFFEPDFYNSTGVDGKYFVSSIYYDTHALQAFYERNDGQFGRIKLRIRTYSQTPSKDSQISVELKTKNGNSMVKYATRIKLDELKKYEAQGLFSNENDEVLCEFSRLQKVRDLQPQLIVRYWREGYVPKIKSSVRVTFDHDVQSTRAKSLFEEDLLFKIHRPKDIILEIKVIDKVPRYLSDIIRKHGLKIMSNSKYVQGIELVSPYLITKTIGIEGTLRG